MDNVDICISKLLESKVIEPTLNSPNQFISSFFLVPKPDGTDRFILNLKKLNQYVETEHFKLEDLRTAINILEKDDYMCSIDLKDAYFMIPVAKSDRKFLRFIHKGTTYQFTALPFGLAPSPYTYTKITKPSVTWLRKQGIRITNYLDDFLIFGKTKEECANNTKIALSLLQRLGFVINFEKSCLEPSKICQHLGCIINSEEMTVELTKKKKENIKTIVDNMINEKNCTFEQLMSIIGKIVAACPSVKFGWRFYKELERFKCSNNHCNKKDKLNLTTQVLKDLIWWSDNILAAKNIIRNFTFQKEIFSDASLTGWGATCNGKSARGLWSLGEQKLHINLLELKAAFLALKCFAANDSNCQILLRIDNITAITYINKMGGIKFTHLNDTARSIWDWCIERNVWIFSEYVASKENPADKESRIINQDTEWELANYAYDKIIRTFGLPDIDLFATRSNKKCFRFCSWQRDPEAYIINSFTIRWTKFFWYAFPPFSLIAKILRKVREDESTGILVVPDWPSQSWYTTFLEMIVGNPLIFKHSDSLLLSPFRDQIHPLSKHLTLIAGVISGKNIKKRD